jgi:hypothetical protein
MANAKDIQPEGNSSILLIGDSGTHKTYFLGTCPKPYIFDFDNGMLVNRGKDIEYDKFIDAPKGGKAKPEQGIYEHGTAWFAYIKKVNEIGALLDTGKCPFKTLGLDSLTMMADLCMNMVLKNNGRDLPTQADWGAFLKAMKTTVQQLNSWPIQVVLTAHIKRDMNDLTQTVEKLPLISGQFSGLVSVLFNEVYFTEAAADKDGKMKFWLVTQQTVNIKQAKSTLGVPTGTETTYPAIAKYFDPNAVVPAPAKPPVGPAAQKTIAIGS